VASANLAHDAARMSLIIAFLCSIQGLINIKNDSTAFSIPLIMSVMIRKEDFFVTDFDLKTKFESYYIFHYKKQPEI